MTNPKAKATTRTGAKTTKVATPKAQSKKVSAKTDVTAKNEEKTLAKVTAEKELKYKYPESCEQGKTKGDVLKLRKKFRHQVRAKLEILNKQARKADDANKAAAVKALNDYRKSVLVNP